MHTLGSEYITSTLPNHRSRPSTRGFAMRLTARAVGLQGLYSYGSVLLYLLVLDA